jgi:acetyl esterase/lipase
MHWVQLAVLEACARPMTDDRANTDGAIGMSHLAPIAPRRGMSMRIRAGIVALAMAVVAGCGFHTITPPGAAPLRYRDTVFDTVTTTSNVSYGSAADQQGAPVDLKLDVYQPAGDTAAARPAIVWVHGGSFSTGDKTSGEIVFEATEMAKKGYVSVSIDYRLYGPGCSATGGGDLTGCIQAMIDAQHDAQAAVRFLRQNAATYRIDTDRIAIAGTSAGAITALHVGANADDPGTSGSPGFSSGVGAAVSLSGAKLLGPPMSEGDAPILLFHGTADPLVPYQWALNTLHEAQAADIVSYLTTYQGEGHVPFIHVDQIMSQTTNFLYWMLDLADAPG